MDTISTGDGHLNFDYTTTTTTTTSSSDGNSTGMEPPLHADQKNDSGTKSERNRHRIQDNDDNENSMVQYKLKQLYQSAHEFGKHQLQVRLDCRPTSAKMQSLFVFPFISRASLKALPQLRDKYHALLQTMSESPHDSIPLWQEILRDLDARRPLYISSDDDDDDGWRMPSTVICQVLLECDEIFWVKDLATGTILQGGLPPPSEEEDGGTSSSSFRRVVHLVRFEMVVDVTKRRRNWILPFDMKLGRWQITDIDDHLKGNLLL